MFENDFESVSGDKFPFHGWTLKGQNTNSTWKQYTYYNWKYEAMIPSTLTSPTTRLHR